MGKLLSNPLFDCHVTLSCVFMGLVLNLCVFPLCMCVCSPHTHISLDNLLNFPCTASLVNNVELPELGKFVNLIYSLVGRQEMFFFVCFFKL